MKHDQIQFEASLWCKQKNGHETRPYMEFEGKFLNAILLTWVGFSKFNFGSTWNAKCPIFLGNFAPKSATIALKIGHQRLSR